MSNRLVAMETGTYTPSLALAIRIARVFGQAVEEIFSLSRIGLTDFWTYMEAKGRPPAYCHG